MTRGMGWASVLLVGAGMLLQCRRIDPAARPSAKLARGSTSVSAVRLADHFDQATVEGAVEVDQEFATIEWRFDQPWVEPEPSEEEPREDPPGPPPGEDPAQKGEEEEELEPPGPRVYGFESLCDVEGLEVREDALCGTAGEVPVLLREFEPLESEDFVHAVEVEMRASAGTELGLMLMRVPRVDRAAMRERVGEMINWPGFVALHPGEEFERYQIPIEGFRPLRFSALNTLALRPVNEAGASFEIRSIRLVSRTEHLAGTPAGIGWHGLGEIYREALALHSPEVVRLPVDLPARPWLDLSVGTPEVHPVTFEVAVTAGGQTRRLLRRTVTTPDRWEAAPLELDDYAGRRVELSFALHSDRPGRGGFFGNPVVRNRGARAHGAATDAPQLVLVVLSDTLRRDHLSFYGYPRQTTPHLAGLVADGCLFEDNISQGSWTKVSVPSILSSMFPTSLGIAAMRDQVPEEVTTLAEAFRQAGYATFATSSVPFSGKNSNLQQGIDVLHERSSVGDLGHSRSKTSRTYVDRLLRWIEAHQDGPMFVFLHVFDPHDPFEPYTPYDTIYSAADAKERHEGDLEILEEYFEEQDEEMEELPARTKLEGAGVAPEAFVARERDWYDESLRAMDVELARLHERLEQLALADRTLMALISDHGEEFLEHGHHFHGRSTYGEITNVPLLMWGPHWVPPGTVVANTVQSLDLMPTLLELSGLALPEQAQGRSLVPLVRGAGSWEDRPAFSERRFSNFTRPEPDECESFSMVAGGYRLIHNVTRPEGRAEFELYDHRADPLNLNDLAVQHPERVQSMAADLALWRQWAEANRVAGGGEAEELTEAERQALEDLGYLR